MLRSISLAFVLIAGISAHATNAEDVAVSIAQAAINNVFSTPVTGARFVVGDTNNYEMSVSSMPGTMVMSVNKVDNPDVTIEQKLELGLFGSQDIIEVVDSNNGHIKSVTVNGQAQTPPDPDDMEITHQEPATITVKAGTFKCLDVKVHMKKENSDAEQWVNPTQVPVGGMLKMTTQAQGMPVSAELTSFKRGQE